MPVKGAWKVDRIKFKQAFKLDILGKEMLSKEQMKQINGGYYGNGENCFAPGCDEYI